MKVTTTNTETHQELPLTFQAINISILWASVLWNTSALFSFFIDTQTGFTCLSIGIAHTITYVLASSEKD